MTTQPDEILTLSCGPDDEGEVVATLVRPLAQRAPGPRAVLSLHGYVDYYFHPHVAQAFVDAGCTFYALDLRKYGRSMRPHQTPWYCRSLTEYYEEITLALRHIQAQGATDITLLGHSTGCLVGALYAAEGAERESIRRLILNSPFLEHFQPALLTRVVNAFAAWRTQRAPYARLPVGLARAYGESLHRNFRGEWDYALEWKPVEMPTTALGFLRAVGEGHKRAQAGLNLPQPILILHSDKSKKAGSKWDEAFHTCDAVLDVAHMKRFGPRLGRNVTLHEIPDGKHDLFLSREPARSAALAAAVEWLQRES